MQRNTFSALMLAALTALYFGAMPKAQAQIIISGHHDSNVSGNGIGYDVQHNSYIVQADTNGSPSATFNNNGSFGLVTFQATLTVSGGQYNGNGATGLYIFDSAAFVTGGQFNNNNDYGVEFTRSINGAVSGSIGGGTFNGNLIGLEGENNSVLTVSGGQFSNNRLYGISMFTGSNVAVTGGMYSGNGYDFYASNGNSSYPGGTIDLFGDFINPATGITMTSGQTFSLTGSGTFFGRLANNSVAQSYTYSNYSSAITLHETVVPEPSEGAVFMIGLLCLSPFLLKSRKRRNTQSDRVIVLPAT